MRNIDPLLSAIGGCAALGEQGDVDETTNVRIDNWDERVRDYIRVSGTTVTRGDLWALADDYRVGRIDVLTLFWTTMCWGALARGRPRVVNSVMGTASDSRAEVSDRQDLLRKAADASHGGDIAAADGNIREQFKGLGPSFFTKFLWITGDRESASPRCVIFDQRTQLGYFVLSGGTWLDQEKRPDYVTFCTQVREWADVLGQEPDEVEARLFNVGRAVGSIQHWARLLARGYADGSGVRPIARLIADEIDDHDAACRNATCELRAT